MNERPLIQKSWNKNIKQLDIVYPNKYFGGVYCLAPLIFYNLVNNKDDWICNRVFLDKGKLNSNLIGFTLQYELDMKNVFEILKKNNVGKDKILFAGGPCVNANYLPDVFDFFVFGTVEKVLDEILDLYTEDKKEFLEKISKIEGVYVPGLSKQITYARLENLDEAEYPLFQPLPEQLDGTFVFGNSFLLEIERGCPFGCKFCSIKSVYDQVQHRSIESLKEIIDKGIAINQRKKVIIYSPSFTHPKRKELLKYLLEKGLEFSIPSLRVELVDEELLELVKKGGQKTLTVAPESNERLRFEVTKQTKDEDFINFAKLASKVGFKKLKYYFMVGLPNTTQNDLIETVELVKKLKNAFTGKTYVSVNPFVPKANTAWENETFNKKEIKNQIKFLKKEFGKLYIDAKFSSASTAEKVYSSSSSNNSSEDSGTNI